MIVVVVYHVTIVAIRHGLLKKLWPLVIGCVLGTAGSYLNLFRPTYFVRTTKLLPHPGHEQQHGQINGREQYLALPATTHGEGESAIDQFKKNKRVCIVSKEGTSCSAYNAAYCYSPKYLQQPMSNCKNSYMVNNNNLTGVPGFAA